MEYYEAVNRAATSPEGALCKLEKDTPPPPGKQSQTPGDKIWPWSVRWILTPPYHPLTGAPLRCTI